MNLAGTGSGGAGAPRIVLHDCTERAPALDADAALQAVWDLLEAVKDPEIPVLSLRELGVLRAVRRDHDGLCVVITPTYSGCPAMRAMEEAVRERLSAAGLVDARVETVLAPAWSSDWISAEGHAKLRAYGIAPPERGRPVACPQCGTTHTAPISEFGSTACKALWRCLDCGEPFDHFKCL